MLVRHLINAYKILYPRESDYLLFLNMYSLLYLVSLFKFFQVPCHFHLNSIYSVYKVHFKFMSCMKHCCITLVACPSEIVWYWHTICVSVWLCACVEASQHSHSPISMEEWLIWLHFQFSEMYKHECEATLRISLQVYI